MNGCLIPHTPFAVDFWRSRECGNTRLFFLSHMHADHTSGLSPSWKHPIYCSEITAKLLVHKFHISPALVHPLGVGESHILALDETGQETMTVTLFDANHCPGAVMFLFQGYFGSIFYTGDFRYSPEMFDHEVLANRPPVDVLYLDNTYCSPECVFPSRTQATQMIKNIISRHPEHDIVLGMTMLGKEDLLVELAKTFQTWVVVTPQRLESLKLLELPNVFTTDTEAGRIRVGLKYQITRKNMEKWNQDRPTIAILPSALYMGLDGKPYANQPDVHIVPYSDHSSYQELHEFVSRLKPRSIIPVVKGNSRGVFGSSLQARADMHCFDNYLDTSAKTAFHIPQSVRKFMFHGSHSSVIDAFAEEVSERKGKSARNCVPAKKGRPMGVVYIDSPQNTPEKAKSQETVAPENVNTDICEETTDKTVATSSEMFLGSSKCMEKSENRVEETVPSCNVGGQVKNRKRKLPASIAILAQAFAYHTGQKGDCDIDPVESSPKRINYQAEEKSNGFTSGNGKKHNSPLTQEGKVVLTQDENSPPELNVDNFSTHNSVNKSTGLSDSKVPSESENGEASKTLKTLVMPPRDSVQNCSRPSVKGSTQSARKGQQTLDAFFPTRTVESKTLGQSFEDNPDKMQSEKHGRESTALSKKSCSDRKETDKKCQTNCRKSTECREFETNNVFFYKSCKADTESLSKSFISNGSSESNDKDVCISDSDSSEHMESLSPKKEFLSQNSQTKSRKSGEYHVSFDVGVGSSTSRSCSQVLKKRAISLVDEAHLEDEIIESLVLEDKATCSPVQKKGKIVLLKNVVF
ncbi:uncharacterized protein LOC144914861 [Branchiostoma floridae x Branchiostoma belcheri]